MQAASIAHKNRHYKTLILLVISMTVGAFFLFWLSKMTPVIPLRGKVATAPSWNKITVRTASTAQRERGFFHYRIDEDGQLFQTNAWKAGSQHPRQLGAIQVLVTVSDSDAGINVAEEKALTRLVSDLRQKYGISANQVRLEKSATLASGSDVDAASRIGL